MSLKHGILGLLLEHPRHGYELKGMLGPVLERDRQINDGVLYPLLSRLERDGLVVKRVSAGEQGRPDRHVLELTAAGRAELEAWLHGDSGEEDEVTYDFFVGHPFLAKCMFFDRLPASAVRQKLTRQKAATRRKLEEFERIRAGMQERRVSSYRIAILELGMAQQRAKLRWLDGLLRQQPPTRRRRRP